MTTQRPDDPTGPDGQPPAPDVTEPGSALGPDSPPDTDVTEPERPVAVSLGDTPPPTQDRPAPESPPTRGEVPVGEATPVEGEAAEPAAQLTPPPTPTQPDTGADEPGVDGEAAADDDAEPAPQLTPPTGTEPELAETTPDEPARELTPPPAVELDADGPPPGDEPAAKPPDAGPPSMTPPSGADAAATAAKPPADGADSVEGNEPVTDTGGSMPIPRPPVSRPPAGSAYGYPTRYAEAPGSGHFQLALPQLGTIVAGPAAGSMIAGIAAILVAFAVGCTGVFGTIMVPVAATVLTVFLVSTAGLLAAVALRQIRRGGGEYRGKGMAVAGLACGGAALLVLLFMLLLVTVFLSG